MDGAALVNEVFTIPLTVDLSDEIFAPFDAAPALARHHTLVHASQTKTVPHVNGNGKAVRSNLPLLRRARASPALASDHIGPRRHAFPVQPAGPLRAARHRQDAHRPRSCPPLGQRRSRPGRSRQRGRFFAELCRRTRRNEIFAWRRRVREASLLVLEDVNQLVAKQSALEELRHTIDALLAHSGQIILTSRLPIEGMTGCLRHSKAACAAGCSSPCRSPRAETRLAILEQFAATQKFDLPAASARILAEGLKVTVPELFGALTELYAVQHADGQPIHAESARCCVLLHRGRLQPSLKTIAAPLGKVLWAHRRRINQPHPPPTRRSSPQRCDLPRARVDR